MLEFSSLVNVKGVRSLGVAGISTLRLETADLPEALMSVVTLVTGSLGRLLKDRCKYICGSICGARLPLTRSALESGVIFPSLHHRKEGWLRHQKNFAKPPKPTQPGWFSFLYPSENHPGLAISGCCATFLLIARPPLLAVMQGGEWPLRNIRTFFTSSN